MGADRCGDEQEQHDQHLREADLLAIRAEVEGRGDQETADPERRRLSRAVQAQKEIWEAGKPDRAGAPAGPGS
jgi:hypothetical protein